MTILNYIYNKNSLHIVNAIRIICVIAIIIIFSWCVTINFVTENSDGAWGIAFIYIISVMGFIGTSVIGLIGAGALDIIEYNKL